MVAAGISMDDAVASVSSGRRAGEIHVTGVTADVHSGRLAAAVRVLPESIGAPDAIVRAMEAGAFECLVCPALLAELERVLRRPKFADRINAEDIDAFLDLIRETATMSDDPDAIPPRAPDPPDDLSWLSPRQRRPLTSSRATQLCGRCSSRVSRWSRRGSSSTTPSAIPGSSKGPVRSALRDCPTMGNRASSRTHELDTRAAGNAGLGRTVAEDAARSGSRRDVEGAAEGISRAVTRMIGVRHASGCPTLSRWRHGFESRWGCSKCAGGGSVSGRVPLTGIDFNGFVFDADDADLIHLAVDVAIGNV